MFVWYGTDPMPSRLLVGSLGSNNNYLLLAYKGCKGLHNLLVDPSSLFAATLLSIVPS